MNVNLILSSLSQGSGGMSACVLALARAVSKKGPSVSIFTLESDGMLEQPTQSIGALAIVATKPSFPKRFGRSYDLKSRLRALCNGAILHGHGLWQLPVHYAAQVARKQGRPLVITPHGMLEPWALPNSRWRKRLAGWLYQERDLRFADCLHAVSPHEVSSFRAYGLDNPIAVVPNGVDPADFEGVQEYSDRFYERFPAARDRRMVLFLSRIHPKKGLPHLIEAWAAAQKHQPDWLLVIAGPQEGRHRVEVERIAADLEVAGSILFTGPLYGDQKLAALAVAEFLVLPSFSEGFSMAVLEAMACCLPVLITPGCNFPEVEEEDAGLVVDPNAEAVEEGLRTLMGTSEAERGHMGERGREMIERRYTWDKVAGQMIEVYAWLVGEGAMPACVMPQRWRG